MNIFLVVANILAVIAFLLFVLCVGLPYWAWKDPVSGAARVYYGLWEQCVSLNSDHYVCRQYGAAGVHHEDWLVSVGALEVMAMVIIFIGLVLGLVSMCCRCHTNIYIMAAVCALFAAISGAIGVIVYGCLFPYGDGSNLHAAFYLAIFAVIFSIVAAIFYFLGKPSKSELLLH